MQSGFRYALLGTHVSTRPGNWPSLDRADALPSVLRNVLSECEQRGIQLERPGSSRVRCASFLTATCMFSGMAAINKGFVGDEDEFREARRQRDESYPAPPPLPPSSRPPPESKNCFKEVDYSKALRWPQISAALPGKTRSLFTHRFLVIDSTRSLLLMKLFSARSSSARRSAGARRCSRS